MQKDIKGFRFSGSSPTIDCRMHTCWSIFMRVGKGGVGWAGGHLSFHSSDGHQPSSPALMHSFAIFVLKEKKKKKNNIKVSPHEMLCPWRLISSHLTVHMKNGFYGFLFVCFFLFLFSGCRGMGY